MKFNRGLDIHAGGMPRQALGEAPAVPLVGLVGSDYPALRLSALVAPGDRVARGQPVLADRRRPDIRLPAPVAGIVDEVALGPRRRLALLSIRPEGEEAAKYAVPTDLTRDSTRALLLEAGLWSTLTARPFGRIPGPDDTPDALFVTATDTEPGAPDPIAAIAAAGDAFAQGIHLLRHLTDAPVYICQPPGDPLVHPGGHVRVETISGPHPAGLAGTHIDRFFPVRHGRTAWQIGYPDVIAVGRLMTTGEVDLTRTVSLSGSLARDPRLFEVPACTALDPIAAAEALPGPRRALSGSPLSGLEARFLRRGHRQISLIPRVEPVPHRRWLPEPRRPLRPAPVIPHAALDAALGPDIPAAALIRALSTGDADEALRLGARALLPEDMALLTYVTGGTDDFGMRLREALDRLEANG